ncbi:MAG TPA: hypothetical protein VK181_17305 [Rhizobium sp.]|nr:hypothetical protein [Rhizobium sp.]
MIGNWEEEEYCRSYLTTLGGGVRRFDDLKYIRTALDEQRNCCNAAVRKVHGWPGLGNRQRHTVPERRDVERGMWLSWGENGQRRRGLSVKDAWLNDVSTRMPPASAGVFHLPPATIKRIVPGEPPASK